MRMESDNVLPADLQLIILANRSNIEYGHNLDPELMNRYIVVIDSTRTTFCHDDALLMKYERISVLDFRQISNHVARLAPIGVTFVPVTVSSSPRCRQI